ncbi:MAG: hypothetical protein KDD52_06815, partial [Bdellovibrionales bacterium]|nr:hypothetical protein [Bdellovibrionales bacterium]
MLKITQWREEGLTQDQFTTKVRKLYLLTNVNSRFKQTIFQYNFHLHEMIRLSNYFEEHKNIDWLPHLKEVSNFMEASEEKIANGTSPNWAYREYGITVSNISRMLIDVINYSFKYDRGHVEDQKMNRKYYILPELQKIPSPSLLNGTNGQAATKRYIKHIRELLAQKRIEFTVKMENTKPEDIVLTPREKKSIDNKAIQDAKIHWHDLKERRARNFWKEAPYMIENHLHKGTLEVLLDDQRAWLAQHLCSNEYLNRLEKEVQKTKTSAKDIKTKRMNQLYKKDYHIKFKDSGFLAKMGVDQLYSKWIPDENVVHFYAYDVALHPIQGIHEFSHQMVQGDEYLTEYAKNLYKQIIP